MEPSCLAKPLSSTIAIISCDPAGPSPMVHCSSVVVAAVTTQGVPPMMTVLFPELVNPVPVMVRMVFAD